MQYNKIRKDATMKKIIENVKFMQSGTLVFGDLYIENGFVERIDYKTPHMESDLLIPGFVDIHTHGFRGINCDEIDPNQLRKLALEYPKRGITSFCATLSSRSLEEYAQIIDAYKLVFQGEYKGARFCGFHLEGPYISAEKAGAVELSNLYPIHISELETFLATYHKDISIMTIAPEVEHADEAIRLLHLYGVNVSLGHTNASYDQTNHAFELGATQITHFGNTMPTIDHRKPNMVDAVFLSDCLCEIIMDGVHLQKEMLRWVIKLLGFDRMIAVSDGECYSGYDDSTQYALGTGLSTHEGGVYKEGILYGGCKDLLNIFQYLYNELEYDLEDCLKLCSINASKMLKLYTYEIALGKRIDFTVLSHDLKIKEVVINGKSAL